MTCDRQQPADPGHCFAGTIHSVSNSRTQKEYIDGKCKELGYSNVTVFTADINDFEAEGDYDRVRYQRSGHVLAMLSFHHVAQRLFDTPV